MTGANQVVNQFKEITGNSTDIIDYLNSSKDIVEIKDIQKSLEPYVADWERVKYLLLKKQLEEAFKKQKLTSGIKKFRKKFFPKKGSYCL